MIPRKGWVFGLALCLLCASFTIDRPVARVMAGASPDLLRVFGDITWFGQGGVILYPAAAIMMIAAAGWLVGVWRSHAKRVFMRSAIVFTVIAGSGLVNDALKILFGRARPHPWLAGDQSGFQFLRYSAKYASFPSGHTATSVAAAVIFSALWPRGRPVFIAFALLIAASRIIIDAHYVSDVIAGAVVGSGIALIILDRLRKSGWNSVTVELSARAPQHAPKAFPQREN